MLLNLALVVIDQDARRQIVGVVAVDSGYTHQFPLDGLAEVPSAVKREILKTNPPLRLVLD